MSQGVALITSLLILAIVSVIASNLIYQEFIAIQRTSSFAHTAQAKMYALGGESWAKQILLRDAKKNKLDSLSDDWAQKLPPIPIDGGLITGNIIDLQGRMNLNNLVDINKVSPIFLDEFKRLLEKQTQEENSTPLANTLIDWMDANDETLPIDGAEDYFYLGKEQPYRAANQPLTELAELAYVKGYDKKLILKLEKMLCVLPEKTKININTAGKQMLSFLFEDFSKTEIEAFDRHRQKKPFENHTQLFKYEAIEKIIKQNPDIQNQLTQLTTFSSAYFLVIVNVKIDQIHFILESILQRNKNTIAVLSRRFYSG